MSEVRYGMSLAGLSHNFHCTLINHVGNVANYSWQPNTFEVPYQNVRRSTSVFQNSFFCSIDMDLSVYSIAFDSCLQKDRQTNRKAASVLRREPQTTRNSTPVTWPWRMKSELLLQIWKSLIATEAVIRQMTSTHTRTSAVCRLTIKVSMTRHACCRQLIRTQNSRSTTIPAIHHKMIWTWTRLVMKVSIPRHACHRQLIATRQSHSYDACSSQTDVDLYEDACG